MNYKGEKIKGLLDAYTKKYEAITSKAREEYIKTLKPNQMIPETIPFHFYEGEWEKVVAETRTQITDIINIEREEIAQKLTDAPSSEAVNTLMLLGMRKNITEGDINNLMERYGNNPQVYQAINDIAQDHNINIYKKHPIVEHSEKLEILADNINHLSKFDVQTYNGMPYGLISMYKKSVDEVFEDAEAGEA